MSIQTSSLLYSPLREQFGIASLLSAFSPPTPAQLARSEGYTAHGTVIEPTRAFGLLTEARHHDFTGPISVLHSQDYHRLHIACLAMAKQSASPEVKARWLAMAAARRISSCPLRN